MMIRHYVGIDIGKNTHVACVLSADNTFSKHLHFNSLQPGFEKFLDFLVSQDCIKEETIIGCEATGHYWLTLFEKLKGLGFTVFVLNPLQVHSFRNESIRGLKTDDRDCELIATVLRFGVGVSAELPNETLYQLRELSRFRHDLVRQISSIKVKALSVLDRSFPEYETVFSNVFGLASTAVLKEYTTAEAIAALDIAKLTHMLETASRKRFSRSHAEKLQQQARNTFGLKFGIDALSLELKILMQSIEHLQKQKALLEKKIEQLVAKQQSTLQTIPGISSVIAGTILGETVGFFKKGSLDPRPLLAYAGLDPKLKESGKWKGQTLMSKRGSPYLREAIWQAALVASVHDTGFKTIYNKQRSKGKPHKVALTYVAKKLTYVVHSVMRTNQPYRPILEKAA
jgi:transposase